MGTNSGTIIRPVNFWSGNGFTGGNTIRLTQPPSDGWNHIIKCYALHLLLILSLYLCNHLSLSLYLSFSVYLSPSICMNLIVIGLSKDFEKSFTRLDFNQPSPVGLFYELSTPYQYSMQRDSMCPWGNAVRI